MTSVLLVHYQKEGGWTPGAAENLTYLTGDLTLELSDEQFSKICGHDGLTVTLGGNASGVKIDEDFSFTIINKDTGASFGSFSSTSNNGFSYHWTSDAIVPEPSTATLSLLALAGLAARRRRV